VRAVIARSYERIHRANLVGMGVLPLQFMDDDSATSLGLRGDECFDILGLGSSLLPMQTLTLVMERADGAATRAPGAVPHRYADRGSVLPVRGDTALRAGRTAWRAAAAVTEGNCDKAKRGRTASAAKQAVDQECANSLRV
jgi:hypothetical protein